jgi:MarR family transcriptional regulator, organic hydroperoxide resistance regulator
VADDARTPPDDPLALESQVCFALALAARGVIGAYRPVLEPLGLTHPQYLVMLALWEHQELTNSELAAMLGLDPGTATPLVRRLVNAGLVQKDRSRDERSVLITLTSEGRALRRRAQHVPEVMVRRLGVSLDEVEQLRTAMHRLIDAARQAQDPTADELAALAGRRRRAAQSQET